jgi:nudix motif 8
MLVSKFRRSGCSYFNRVCQNAMSFRYFGTDSKDKYKDEKYRDQNSRSSTSSSVPFHNLLISDAELETLMVETNPYDPQKKKGYGVYNQDESDDIEFMLNSFPSPSLAKALREREQTLQICARLLSENKLSEVGKLLRPYKYDEVMKRRNKKRPLDLRASFGRKDIVIIQRYLHRMPRKVFHVREKRASVVIPLCNDNGVASVLFEKRSSQVRTHKNEVCFPGGMVDESVDSTIIQTSLRETAEELGIPIERIDVLGVLRCDWDEVEEITGVAVTPVVGWLGDLKTLTLTPNADEVAEYFTVPLYVLMDESKWTTRERSAPVFTGGPHVIWGLTGYLLRRFLKDVVEMSATGTA